MTLERTEAFAIDRAGNLVQSVAPKRGKPYQHICTLACYQNVAHAAEEIDDAGFVLEDLVAQADVPFTQAAVALAFFKERGCVITERKRNYPAGPGLHADAMIEYHALRENARP